MKSNWGMRAGALAIGIALSTAVVTPVHAATASSASSALTWIEKELTASGHRFQVTSGDQNFDDIGLTIDGLLALSAGGRGGDAEANASSDYVVAHVSDYATGGQFAPTDRYAGALGKSLLMAEVRDLSTTMGGLNLETEARARMQTTGTSVGRFSDKSSEFQGTDDFSNGIGDAIDVMALAGTTNGAPAAALTWLIHQQCPNGGFRSDYQVHLVATEATTTDTSCTVNSQADLDATSFALLALGASSDGSDPIENAIEDGLNYVLDQQANDGSFATGNGNSTGLAASVLRSYGDAPDANAAAQFIINNLQLSSGADAGAIALTKSGADAAKTNGVTAQTRPTFERTTPQAVLALGLPSYIDIGSVSPVEPATTASLSASSVQIGSPITVSGQGFAEAEKVDFVLHSDPITVGSVIATSGGVVSLTFNAPAAAGAGAHTLTLTGADSGATVSVPITFTAASSGATSGAAATTTTTTPHLIPRTGGNSGSESGVAGGLILLGGALVIAARKRRIIYPFKK